MDTRRPVRNVNARWSRTVGVLVLFSVLVTISAPAPATARQEEGLRIVVIEGEDSVNVIGQGTAVATVVEVRDRNDLPVSGASVLFLLGEGGTATLNAGLSQVSLTTNALGQVAVTVNPIASGAVQLQVSAAFQGQTAAAAITQTNFATAAQAAAGGGGATGGGGAAATGGGAAGGGGGLGTGALVGIVAAGAGAAVAGTALSGGGSPPVAALSVTPAGAGMAGATEYRFDGGGSSDPDQDSLTYSWDFGDGNRGSGVVAAHVYDTPGTYSVTLTVSDGSDRVNAGGSVTVARNLDGTFVGVITYDATPWDTELNLTQSGESIGGTFADYAIPNPTSTDSGTVSGSIDSTGNFVCPCELDLSLSSPDFGLFPFRGTVDSGATELVLMHSAGSAGSFTLSRR